MYALGFHPIPRPGRRARTLMLPHDKREALATGPGETPQPSPGNMACPMGRSRDEPAAAIARAGWGRTAFRRRGRLHLLLPRAVDRAHRVQDRARHPGRPRPSCCSRRPWRTSSACLPASISAVRTPEATGFDLFLFQLDLHRRDQRAAGALYRHPSPRTAFRATRCAATTPTCFLILMTRMLPAHRHHHSPLHPVSVGAAERHLHRDHPALHGIQPALHHLDDEEFLRRVAAGGGRTRRGSTAAANGGSSSASACRRSRAALPQRQCSGLILTWNEFLFAFILSNDQTRTIPVAMAQKRSTSWGLLAATETLFLLPVAAAVFVLAGDTCCAGLTFGTIRR